MNKMQYIDTWLYGFFIGAATVICTVMFATLFYLRTDEGIAFVKMLTECISR